MAICMQIILITTLQYEIPVIIVKQYPCLQLPGAIWQDQATVDKLNAILSQETARYKNEKNLIVWDSFEKLMYR